METMPTFPISFLLQWKICLHYFTSTHLSWFGSHSSQGLWSYHFHASQSWIVHFSLFYWIIPVNTHKSSYISWPHVSPCYHPIFYIHCLHFFVSLSHPKGSSVPSPSLLLLSPRSPRLASLLSTVMVTCWLSLIQSLGTSPNSGLSWVSLSFWDAFFLFMPVAALSPACLLLLRLLVNNFINSYFSITPLRFRVS